MPVEPPPSPWDLPPATSADEHGVVGGRDRPDPRPGRQRDGFCRVDRASDVTLGRLALTQQGDRGHCLPVARRHAGEHHGGAVAPPHDSRELAEGVAHEQGVEPVIDVLIVQLAAGRVDGAHSEKTLERHRPEFLDAASTELLSGHVGCAGDHAGTLGDRRAHAIGQLDRRNVNRVADLEACHVHPFEPARQRRPRRTRRRLPDTPR